MEKTISLKEIKKKVRYETYREPVIVSFIVKEMSERFPDKQLNLRHMYGIGYYLHNKNVFQIPFAVPTIAFNWRLGGPQSTYFHCLLEKASSYGFISMDWDTDKGWFIKPKKKLNRFLNLLTDEEKENIKKLLDELGEFKSIDKMCRKAISK